MTGSGTPRQRSSPLSPRPATGAPAHAARSQGPARARGFFFAACSAARVFGLPRRHPAFPAALPSPVLASPGPTLPPARRHHARALATARRKHVRVSRHGTGQTGNSGRVSDSCRVCSSFTPTGERPLHRARRHWLTGVPERPTQTSLPIQYLVCRHGPARHLAMNETGKRPESAIRAWFVRGVFECVNARPPMSEFGTLSPPQPVSSRARAPPPLTRAPCTRRAKRHKSCCVRRQVFQRRTFGNPHAIHTPCAFSSARFSRNAGTLPRHNPNRRSRQ